MGKTTHGWAGSMTAAASALALAAGAGLLASAAQAEARAARPLAIVGAIAFDATGAPPRPATVVIENGRITAVGPKVKIPRGA